MISTNHPLEFQNPLGVNNHSISFKSLNQMKKIDNQPSRTENSNIYIGISITTFTMIKINDLISLILNCSVLFVTQFKILVASYYLSGSQDLCLINIGC